MLTKRVNRIGLSTTLRISAAAKALRAEGVDVVDLSIGEPDYPTPAHVKEAAKRALDDNLTGYTPNDGVPELKRAIASKFKRENNLDYELEEVLVSPGAKYSLYLATMALVDRGEEVILPAPYWVSYPEQIRLAGGVPVVVNTREEDGFRLTPARLRSAITFNTKAIILNYPSNPAGATYTRDELAELGEVCKQAGVWIIADEIYEKLSYDGHTHVSVAALAPELKKRTIVVNGMSKAYSMTGWRIGYAAGPREVIGAMAKIQSHSTSNATSIAQYASVAAMEGPQGDLARMAGEMLRRRNTLLRRLESMDGVSCATPHGAFYLFPNVATTYTKQYDGCPVRNSYGLAYYLMKEAHIAVVPGDPFGGVDNIRISYATSMDRLELGMTRMAEALDRLERPRSLHQVQLDNVTTRVTAPVAVEVAASAGSERRLAEQADAAIAEEEYREWNANIGGLVLQLRTNSPHLADFWQENWYPAQLEGDLEPHAVIYAAKNLPGKGPSCVTLPGGRAGFVLNTAFYGQLRGLALGMVADAAEQMSGAHLVRAAAVDINGRGLLLMGGPGSGLSGQLWRLCRQPGVRLVSTDAVLLRHTGGEVLADLLERKLYLKTKWVRHESKLASLFDRSKLENAVTSEHANSRCDGGERCPVTRGLGACYVASNESRAMLDPYWLGGPKRHTKRTSVHTVLLFRSEPVGDALSPMSPEEAMSSLERAQLPGPGGGSTSAPWFNDYLPSSSAARMDAQRERFRQLFSLSRPLSANTAYMAADQLTDRIIKAVIG